MVDDPRFEWDEIKRQATLDKHGIDFVRARRVFDGPYLELPSTHPGPEARALAIGALDDIVIVVVFTRRGDIVRIITARRARDHERKAFRSLYA